MTPELGAPATGRDPLAALWSARSVAVIGASDKTGSLGRLPVEFLQRYGYAGRILPVRPDGTPVAGLRSYASLRECVEEQGPVDLAMVMVAASRVLAAVQDCAAAGVPVAVICTSGFAETGEQGAALQDEVVRAARDGGVRLVGPNCIGSVGVATGQVTSFSPLFSGEHTELVPGDIGFVSQSGALGYGAVSLAFERGLGLGWVVNTGNEADVSAVEVMRALTVEPGCRGLLAYLETVADFEGLRAVAATGTPVAVLKAGRSDAGARAAASHTGALAAGDRVVDAALRQLGIVRVDDVDELLDVGDAMTARQRPKGRRVAVVTTSGGSGILAADAIEAHGLQMAELSPQTRRVLDEIVPAFGSTANPVDVTASVMSNASLFDRTLDVIADDPGVDLIVACFCVLTGKDVDDVVTSLARVAERSGIPVVAVRTGADHLAPDAGAQMRAAGIPCYPTPARAVRAAAALVQFSAERPAAPAPARLSGGSAGSAGSAAEAVPSAGASEQEMKELLAAAGIPVPGGRVATSAEDAREAVAEVGGHAVLKAVVPGLLHKSDAGGVIVGVTAQDAGAAWEKVAALGGEVLVEELVPGGVEALVGVSPSPLGPVLAVGVGGVLTEVLHDVALRVLPVDRDDVEAMVDETRLGALLSGVRGAAPADREALVEAVLRVSDLVAAWPAGVELDLNPVTVLAAGRGVRVLDAAYIAPSGPTARQEA
ncbi:acetate--CoA ligase family protein [Knoellia sp. p5-6-4]|uniref:acetate--CoA ligase family protein n=1 Tax=unclassified Knoellia TaxID=2618719 RepID=UPI0023DBA498|nr:acetate--CoA ligase family protein [Knoellia sp. p5-6-4]MDF2145373.1 acetate--CoA ligase family protein [Knoellia sp. p5-6-4]